MTVENDCRSRQAVVSRDRVLSDVKRIVGEELGIAPEDIEETCDLVSDLGSDSLTLVEIVMQIEDHFAITVPDDLGEKVQTVGDVVEGVWQLLRGSRDD